MGENRSEQRDRLQDPGIPLREAEVLRIAAASAADEPRTAASAADEPRTAAKPAKPEDSTPLFWRVFGTTLMSIAALVAMTLYQQLSSGLNDVRFQLKAVGEASGDWVKKEEFSARSQSLSNSIKEVQASNAAALALWKERSALLDRQVQAEEEDFKQQIKELNRELQRLRERVAVMESRPVAPPAPASPRR